MSNPTETDVTILDALKESALNHKEYSFSGQDFPGIGFYVQSIGGLHEKPNENKFWFIYELDSYGKHVSTDGLKCFSIFLCDFNVFFIIKGVSSQIKNNSHYVFHYKMYENNDFEPNNNWLSRTSNYLRNVFHVFKSYANFWRN